MKIASCTSMWRALFRFVLYSMALVLTIIVVLALFAITPLHRYEITEQPFYQQSLSGLDSLEKLHPPKAPDGFQVGYAKMNITPAYRTSTAGHGNRGSKLFTTVHDSLFVRAMVVSNGAQQVALASVDLLLMPPSVREKVEAGLIKHGFQLSELYFSATHTHNGTGNWGYGAIGYLYGSYDEQLVEMISAQITKCILQAKATMQPAALSFGKILVPSIVENRLLNDTTSVDRSLRMLVAQYPSGKKMALTSFTAHATCLSSDVLELSRDYPGLLVDQLEGDGYEFAMFMAGGVASHAPRSTFHNWEKIEHIAAQLSQAAQSLVLHPITDSTLYAVRFPLRMAEPQLKISQDWALRPWVFQAAFGNEPVYLSALRLGDLVMLSTPCDFSGQLSVQLDSLHQQTNLVITSFNGGYVGYITPDMYYDVDHYETRLMNWFGPGNGEYFTICLSKLVDAVTNDPE